MNIHVCRGLSLVASLLVRRMNVLFNDALNTFYIRLYAVRHVVKDHSDSERGNPLPLPGLFFILILYALSHRQDKAYYGLCYTSRGALAVMSRKTYECVLLACTF